MDQTKTPATRFSLPSRLTSVEVKLEFLLPMKSGVLIGHHSRFAMNFPTFHCGFSFDHFADYLSREEQD